MAATVGAAQDTQKAPETAPANTTSATSPKCEVAGTRQLHIVCEFTPVKEESFPPGSAGLVAITYAELTFGTRDENWANITLKLMKLNDAAFSEEHLVYLEIDDDAGNNYIRRLLPGVKLSALAAGKPGEFTEHILFPALRPGHYEVKLWMPSAEPKNKFSPAHNLLVSSIGVGDEATGLNRLAAFSVKN